MRGGPSKSTGTGLAATLLVASLLAGCGSATKDPVEAGAVDPAPAASARQDPARPADPVAEQDAGAAPVAADDADASYDISGWLSTSYRARTRGGRNDEDLYGYLSLDGGNADRDDVLFHLFGRATLDLDGGRRDHDTFASLNDIGGSDLDLKLYEAYIDLVNDAAPTSLGMKRVRLGRQNVHAGFTYLVDGLRLDFEPVEDVGALEVSVFGGIPEFLYESSRSGDWLAGIDLAIKPTRLTRVDLRYIHVEDRNDWIGSKEVDDYASVTVRQTLFDDVHVTAAWNTLDAKTRDVTVRVSWDVPDADLAIRAAYRFQDDITREFTTPFDPYVGVLDTSYAYHQVDIQVSKLFGDHFSLDAGFTTRQLDDDSRDSPFNREFIRGWLTASTHDLPVDGLSLSLTGEVWDGGADRSLTAGGEIEWRDDDVRISAGSFYSLYKYDLFVVQERQDATTIFVRVRWEFLAGLHLNARYEFETGDDGDYHAFLLGLTWRF